MSAISVLNQARIVRRAKVREPRKAIFFDRDGTLIRDGGYLHKPEDVKIFPQVRETLSSLKSAGFLIFLLSNQSGVARGYFSEEEAFEFNDAFVEKLALGADFFDGIRLAFEAPGDFGGYRKPSPKYVRECSEKFSFDARDAWIIGDRIGDWQTADNAGCRAIAVCGDVPFGARELAFLQYRKIPTLMSVAALAGFFDLSYSA